MKIECASWRNNYVIFIFSNITWWEKWVFNISPREGEFGKEQERVVSQLIFVLERIHSLITKFFDEIFGSNPCLFSR